MITWHSNPHRLNLKSHAMSKLEFIFQKFSILRHYSTPLGVINNHRAYANKKRRHDSSPQRKTWLTMEFQSNPIRDSFSWIICRLVVGGCNQPTSLRWYGDDNISTISMKSTCMHVQITIGKWCITESAITGWMMSAFIWNWNAMDVYRKWINRWARVGRCEICKLIRIPWITHFLNH